MLVGAVITFKGQLPVIRAVLAISAIAWIPLLQYKIGIIYFKGDAVMASAYLFGFALAIIVGYALARENKEVLYNSIFGYLLVAAMVSTGMVIYQWLELSNLSPWVINMRPGHEPGGNLSQRNLYGSLVAVSLVGVFYFYSKKNFGHSVVGFLSLFFVLGLAICQSRTTWIVFAVSCIWVVTQRGNIKNYRKILAVLLALAGFYFLYTLILLPYIADLLLIQKEQYIRSAEIGNRAVMWTQLISAALDSSWFGNGWNQVGVAQTFVAQDFDKSTFTFHSHNLFIDLLNWNGLFLGIVIIGLILRWAYKQIRYCKTSEQAYVLWAIGCLAVHSMLEFPIEFAFFLIPLGLLVGSLEQVSGSKEIKFINRKAFSTLSTATAVTLIVLVFNDYQIAEAENRKMRFASAGFVGIEDMKVEGKTYLLTQLSALHNFAETEATEDMSAKELDFMSKVATRYPYPPSLFRYALALGLNHDYQESQRILAVLQKLHDEDIYAEAVDNWGILTDKYPQLANVKPPSVDTALLDGEF